MNPERTLLTDWPSEPDPNLFAQRGFYDGGLPNACALDVESGLTVIRYRARSDLASFTGLVAPPSQADERSQSRSSPAYAWVVRPLKWLALLLGASLGVAITERAYYIFGGNPAQTLLLTIGVEILILYAGHEAGDRIREWPHLSTRIKIVAATLIVTTVVTALAVAMMRLSALGQGQTSHASTPVEFAFFAGLGLLVLVAATNAAVGPGRKSEREARMEPSVGEPMSAAKRAQVQRERHDQWMACQWAYLQAYRAAAAPEHAAELEQVEPVDIRLSADSWGERELDQ